MSPFDDVFDDVFVTENDTPFTMFAKLLMDNDLNLEWCDINTISWFAEIHFIYTKFYFCKALSPVWYWDLNVRYPLPTIASSLEI